jgi:hypothetical protein
VLDAGAAYGVATLAALAAGSSSSKRELNSYCAFDGL